MATLEQRQRQIENPHLTCLEFKFLSTLWRRATRSEFFIAGGGGLSDDHPSAALRTGDAPARDAIRYRMIILRFSRSNLDCVSGTPRPSLDLRVLWPYAPWVVNGTTSV